MDSGKPACQTSVSPAVTDSFERLPDCLILIIFRKIADIRTLGRCCVVSKRFSLLATQTDNIIVHVDSVTSVVESEANIRGRGLLGQFFGMFCASIVKPFRALHNLFSSKKEPVQISHHSPGEVLNNFTGIQDLRIILPEGELGIEEGVLLKWKAEFGSSLESCVMLGASSIVKGGSSHTERGGNVQSGVVHETEAAERAQVEETDVQDDTGCIPESFYTDGSLKLRVFWTISSLIAASARHYLLQRIIADHLTLENLVLTDADGQGTLCMNAAQLQRFREEPLALSPSTNRTEVPALNMKLWYAPVLDLPGGTRLNGATLVAVKPSQASFLPEISGNFFLSSFEEPYKTAVSSLLTRRTYVLEMNSFW